MSWIDKLTKQAMQAAKRTVAGTAIIARIKKWQAIIDRELRANMRTIGYKPGGSIYRRGTYPNATQRSPIKIDGTSYVGSVGYSPHFAPSFMKGYSGVDVPSLFEHGYHVNPSVPWHNIQYLGWRQPQPIIKTTVERLQAAAYADGVTLTYN